MRVASAVLLLLVSSLAYAQPAPELVVAVFRHGVRSPLKHFACDAGESSNPSSWPRLQEDWNSGDNTKTWGDLTPHGRELAKLLGKYYATRYCGSNCRNGYKAVFWADLDNRTKDTAAGLRDGMIAAGVPQGDVTVGFLPAERKGDPLFHPFKAKCGTPDADTIRKLADDINRQVPSWYGSEQERLNTLYDALGCRDKKQCVKPVPTVQDHAAPCVGDDCSSPLKWTGRFSYGSSSSEAFLLEYANNMAMKDVGWGRVVFGQPSNGKSLVHLHEFFFTQTERPTYISTLSGSNLIREVFHLVNRKAGILIHGCPRARPEAKFVGLVGHDTNLAHLGTLLKLTWSFDDKNLPSDLQGLPANNALPAGALVFELRRRSGEWFVGIDYVTQTPLQMRTRDKADQPVRVAVGCPDRPCEMTLSAFIRLVNGALGKDNPFLSQCNKDRDQVCGVR